MALIARSLRKPAAAVRPGPSRKRTTPPAGQRTPAAGAVFGGPAVPHITPLATAPAVQPKLEIGPPNDRYEQEADRIADEVLRMPEPRPAGRTAIGLAPHAAVQRMCAECEEELQGGPDAPRALMRKGLHGRACESVPGGGLETATEDDETVVMAKRDGAGAEYAGPALASRLGRSRARGIPLSAAARAFMEPRFGHDFSTVRVHSDPDAARMANELDAIAFTFGRHIYFNQGRYAPTTAAGRRLLAHELTHVIQQTTGRAPLLARQPVYEQAGGGAWIQRYSLRGFPPREETAMRAAIPTAIAKVRSCSKLSWWADA